MAYKILVVYQTCSKYFFQVNGKSVANMSVEETTKELREDGEREIYVVAQRRSKFVGPEKSAQSFANESMKKELEPESSSEPEPEARLESEPEPVPGLQPEPGLEPRSEPEPIPDSDPRPEPVRDVDPEPEPIQDPDPEPEPIRDLDPEPELELEPEPKLEPELEEEQPLEDVVVVASVDEPSDDETARLTSSKEAEVSEEVNSTVCFSFFFRLIVLFLNI